MKPTIQHSCRCCVVCLCTVQRYNQTGDRYRYRGIDSWCDGSSGATPLDPCPDMSIFECEPIDDLLKRHLPAGTKAAIAVGAFLVTLLVLGLLGYLMLAKASKFRRYLALSTIRLKGAPRSGRMTLVVTDIEGYSGTFLQHARAAATTALDTAAVRCQHSASMVHTPCLWLAPCTQVLDRRLKPLFPPLCNPAVDAGMQTSFGVRQR